MVELAVALIVACPALTAVTSPELLMLATDLALELQLAEPVKSWFVLFE